MNKKVFTLNISWILIRIIEEAPFIKSSATTVYSFIRYSLDQIHLRELLKQIYKKKHHSRFEVMKINIDIIDMCFFILNLFLDARISLVLTHGIRLTKTTPTTATYVRVPSQIDIDHGLGKIWISLG